jgi:hypothetical protein
MQGHAHTLYYNNQSPPLYNGMNNQLNIGTQGGEEGGGDSVRLLALHTLAPYGSYRAAAETRVASVSVFACVTY